MAIVVDLDIELARSRMTLGELAERTRAAGVTRTAVIVVGEVLAAQRFTDSYLYSPARRRGSRH